MPKFMLLLRGGDDYYAHLSPEETQKIIQQYFAFADKLRSGGHYLGGDELTADGKVVRMKADAFVVDGPYTETKEGIGGYYLIEARDLDEAAELAKDCPSLAHGGLIDIRPINEYQ